jgi:hypothetical protein
MMSRKSEMSNDSFILYSVSQIEKECNGDKKQGVRKLGL